MPGMTLVKRQRAVGMLEAGMSLTDVALHFNRHFSTIDRLRHRFQATGSVKDRPWLANLGKRRQGMTGLL